MAGFRPHGGAYKEKILGGKGGRIGVRAMAARRCSRKAGVEVGRPAGRADHHCPTGRLGERPEIAEKLGGRSDSNARTERDKIF